MTRSSRKSASAGIAQSGDKPLRSVGSVYAGSRVELLERALHAGTMRPELALEPGETVMVMAHVGDPIESVIVRIDRVGAPGPYWISPNISVRVLSETRVSQRVEAASKGDSIDPLLKAVS